MNAFNDSLTERLARAGITITADSGAGETESPWYIKALLALAGWVAAVLILGFVGAGLSDLLDSSVASALLGLIMIGVAFALLHKQKNDFAEHLALAISLAGQLLVAWAVGSALSKLGAGFWWFLALMHIALAAVMPNFVHRVFSAFAATLSVALAMSESGAPYLIGGFTLLGIIVIWLHEFRYPDKLRLVQAIGYGLVLGLLTIQWLLRFGPLSISPQGNVQHWVQPWIGEVIAGAAMIYLIWHLFQRAKQAVSPLVQTAVYTSAILLSLASFQAYGLTQGLVILVLGFAVSNRLLAGLGLISLLFSISSYYYLLDVTLMTKAQTLLGLGLLLLAARELMNRLVPRLPPQLLAQSQPSAPTEEQPHA